MNLTHRTRPRHSLAWNVGTSLAQVVVSALLLFFLYRFLVRSIGVEGIGVWSLVTAAAAAARLGDGGLSGSAVKFVAKYVAKNDLHAAASVVQTALITTAVFFGVLLLAIAPVLNLLLSSVVPGESQDAVRELLPWSLFSLWFLSIGATVAGSLDGLHRIDLRNLLLMGGASLQLIFALWLIPGYGLLGLLYGQVLQACLLVIVGWCLLRRSLPTLPPFPLSWDWKRLKEMFGYSLNFQAIGVLTILFDPMTKGLLSSFGGVGVVGYFDMASRLVLQVRQLLMAAVQALTPVFAELQEINPPRVRAMYEESYRFLFFISIPFFGFLVAALPMVSIVWLGEYSVIFCSFASLLAAGWWVNTLSAPAWIANLGTGRPFPNTVGTLLTGVCNAVGGLMAGLQFGYKGVIGAWVLGLIGGGAVVVSFFHARTGIGVKGLVPNESWRLLLFGWGVVAVGVILTSRILEALGVVQGPVALLAAFFLLFFPVVWIHPLRSRAQQFLANALRRKNS